MLRRTLRTNIQISRPNSDRSVESEPAYVIIVISATVLGSPLSNDIVQNELCPCTLFESRGARKPCAAPSSDSETRRIDNLKNKKKIKKIKNARTRNNIVIT